VNAQPVTPELSLAVEAQMEADGHALPGGPATHVLVGSTGIYGAFSVRDLPVIWFWMDTRTSEPLASWRAWREVERVATELGCTRIVLPIQTDSPFHPFIKRMGFSLIGPCELYFKPVN
jgi:hypothetical protein